jgi:hypothetical protein
MQMTMGDDSVPPIMRIDTEVLTMAGFVFFAVSVGTIICSWLISMFFL